MHTDIVDLSCQIEEICRFCMPPEKERILYESSNFYVMVSLGPIVEGYLLLVSKKHIGACLQIPPVLLNEYDELKQRIREILFQVYGCCIFYEHGKTGSCLSTGKDHRHCFHAHLHCIPVSTQLNKIVEKELHGECFQNIQLCRKEMADVEKYLYIEDDRIMTYKPTENLRSQYLRYKLATSLGEDEKWNWVTYQNWPLIKKSITRLKPYFHGTR